MNLREKLAQLMMVRIGSNLPPTTTVDEDAGRIEQLLKQAPLGGLLLFNGRFPQTISVLKQLQNEASQPFLVASDLERGCGQQMHGLTTMPHAMTIDHVEDASASAAELGRLTATQARACGIHILFGPVADVHSNVANPIIATRAFSRDANRAAAHVSDFIRGCQTAGAAATIKHFPGHGDTQQDSHDSLPIVTHDRKRLEECELKPFAAGVAAGVKIAMTAHVAFPALDPSGLPATLSRSIIQDVLRKEMGFEGVVASDSLLMAGVRDRFATETEMCLAALQAGVDLLLDLADPVETLDGLEAAIASGKLSQHRVEEAASRVAKLRSWVAESGSWDGNIESATLTEQETSQFAQDLAVRSIVPLQQAESRLRLDAPTVAVMMRPFQTAQDPVEQPLGDALRKKFDQLEYIELLPESDDALYQQVRQSVSGDTQVILAVVVKPAAWQQFALAESHCKLLEDLCQNSKCCVGIALGIPEAFDDLSFSAGAWCTFSDVEVSQTAVAGFLANKSAKS